MFKGARRKQNGLDLFLQRKFSTKNIKIAVLHLDLKKISASLVEKCNVPEFSLSLQMIFTA